MYVITRWFNKLRGKKPNECIVTLEIETMEKLPDEFYNELTILLRKYTTGV
jgi:SET domain-containing protein